MSLEKFRQLLPALKNAGGMSLSGLAEPLLNRDLVPIVNCIKETAHACHISIFTNAMLLTKDLSRQLVDAGLDRLDFSLDGVDATSVDLMRRKSSLATVLNNIRTLQVVKRSRGSVTPELAATMVLHRGNYHQLPDVVRLAHSVGVTRLDVNGLEPYTEEMVQLVLWYPPPVLADLPDVLQEAAERAEALGVGLGLASLIPAWPECRQPEVPMILANGDVTSCAVLAYERDYYFTIDSERGVREARDRSVRRVFGNVFEADLHDIWNRPDYVAFRRDVLKGKFPPVCRHCLIKHQHICVRTSQSPHAVVAALRERLRSQEEQLRMLSRRDNVV
jgi:MoaA/NifB/PqqE/SkfB family radical SAM enzyme